MKSTATSTNAPSQAGQVHLSGFTTKPGKVRQQATSIVLKTTADPQRQHAAIAKLMKMCKASAVVATASQGITAEVRRDRDRGHD
ncbi:MAG: hypothetical protein FD135_1750 [Comamonadaceae bacterium]|nr:MAG: hypothetical protein FD135_1750 [Comamonadaceae bacterium]